ncbi:TonB-dependent receptor [Duganella phyllosphaerae]|uniref:Vitamin B12 transporter BtuB n=1 Tax=Duganella phyllosphaerae TaxID=762836 RepID=A0A1E7W4T5_9BURK|nr:TonB-dependent receptor [Duganella phyllosphaerae]OEZ90763.1 vitamin B12 transporter BtuB [Duganella phyllosphaerae]
MKHNFKKTAIAMGLAQMALMLGAAQAQEQAQAPVQSTGNDATVNTAAAPAGSMTSVVVTGQRAALQSAQKIKQNADEVVDSIAADDIGKLPDRSVTEVLQRVSGVTIDRAMARSDPDHFSVEGSGVSVRGLSYVRSELNGRDSFSANGGRSLNFEDVPPELMAGVDIYKNPSAEQVEGAIGGLINLRTAMPFDYKGFKAAISGSATHSELRKGKASPSYSGMVSNRWKTPIGEIGALVDLAYSESATRTDAVQVEPYYQIQDNGRTVWVPKGAQWRSLNFDRTREGAYGALQWKPSSTLTTGLTFFKSKYKMQWDEQAIFGSADPYAIKVTDGEYGDNGALLKGTLTNTDPTKGINFNNDTRTAWRKSDTTDISWNARWRPNDRWTIVTDLQKIRANTRSVDSTVATGLKMPKEQLDLTGSVPSITFDAADRAYLANPNNYYWAFTMEHLDRAKAESKAGKIDLKYDFDNPILRDIRFGARLTDRDSTTENSNPSYNWQGITQDWMGGLQGKLAYLGDPRFSGSTNVHSFKNFFNGKIDVPAVAFPDVSLARGYPDSYAKLHSYRGILCAENGTTCDPWNQATFGGDPKGINQQSEKTKALYAQTRFGFDDLKYPIDGNIGLRMVKTDSHANGYTLFSSSATPGPGIPVIVPYARAENFDNSYRNWLPSLNLRLKATDTLQFRFAFASALSRPDPSQLQAYTKLTQSVDNNSQVVSYTGEAEGNPNLRPITAKQVDLTAEWYFSPVGSITLAVFNKRLKDVIVKQTTINRLPDTAGVMHDFTTTSPVNGAKGRARGFELAYQQYFDKLPGAWSGLGIQGNFTFVDSERTLYNGVYSQYCTATTGAANLNLNLNGCDTNGTTFGNLPLENLSRQSYNLALMYDKGPWSARMAYNWRSKSLQAVNVSGTNGTDGTDTNPASPTVGQHNVAWGLPTWADDYGQADASLSYKINDRMQIGIEAQNLTDSKYKILMQQSTGLMGRSWFSSGRRYTARLTYNFE